MKRRGDLDRSLVHRRVSPPSRAPTRRFTELPRSVHCSLFFPSELPATGHRFTVQIRPSTSALLLSRSRARVSRHFDISLLSCLIRGSPSFRRLRQPLSLIVLEVCCWHLSINTFLISWKQLLPWHSNTLLLFCRNCDDRHRSPSVPSFQHEYLPASVPAPQTEAGAR